MTLAEYVANLEHSVKLLTERLDWLEIHVKALQDKVEKMNQKQDKFNNDEHCKAE